MDGEEEVEELDVTIEGVEEEDEEEEENSGMWDTWDGDLTLLQTNMRSGEEQRAKRPQTLQLLSNTSQVGTTQQKKRKRKQLVRGNKDVLGTCGLAVAYF